MKMRTRAGLCRPGRSHSNFAAGLLGTVVVSVACRAQVCAPEVGRLLDPVNALDRFGSSVSIDGDIAVAGAPNGNALAGIVYIFARSGATWSSGPVLTAPDAAASDEFGISACLSGGTVAVGADRKNGGRGAAYIYAQTGTTWTYRAKLVPSDPAANDHFGISIALDGNTVVIGADNKSSASGAAYVFVRSGVAWTQQAKLTASDAANGDHFGISVSIRGDTALVGAQGKSNYTGAAYLYTRFNGVWTQRAKLVSTDGAINDYFGNSVSVYGDTALVGAPQLGTTGKPGKAHVFVRSGAAWTHQAKLLAPGGGANDFFGWSVAVTDTGAVVGATGTSASRGAAYVFSRSGNIWTTGTKIAASNALPSDAFGYSVAFDGGVAVVGAAGTRPGVAYVHAVSSLADLACPPRAEIICPGGTASFGALCQPSGIGASISWRHDGVVLQDGPTGTGSVIYGATTGKIVISNARTMDVGSYDYIAQTACGSLRSAGAPLVICFGDFNCDGFTDGIDYDTFNNLYEAADPRADCNGDHFVDGIDYDLFVSDFENGCGA